MRVVDSCKAERRFRLWQYRWIQWISKRTIAPCCRAGPPRVGGGPQARGAAYPVQSSRPRVYAMPSAGLPAGAVNPTGLDPRSPPRRRGPRQGRRGAEGNGAERRPEGLALTGWRRAVGWSKCPVGPHARRGRDEQRCRGRQQCGHSSSCHWVMVTEWNSVQPLKDELELPMVMVWITM